jgi:hypothetical protein
MAARSGFGSGTEFDFGWTPTVYNGLLNRRFLGRTKALAFQHRSATGRSVF